jgi:ubiquinone/menaquinone biosynthesis C-methylase UbiE
VAVELERWEEHFANGWGFRHVASEEMNRLATCLNPRPGQRALDVGCGLGGCAVGLARLGYRTLAVDWADASVAAVRDRYMDAEPRLAVRRLDFADERAVRELLPSAGFDVVTMRLVLAFMTDKAAVGRRVRRLLVPGGAWVVTTPLAERLPEERRYIGMTAQEVAELIEGWDQGCWYDLEPDGPRCFVLRR